MVRFFTSQKTKRWTLAQLPSFALVTSLHAAFLSLVGICVIKGGGMSQKEDLGGNHIPRREGQVDVVTSVGDEGGLWNS